jgi:hypothetical protein
LSAQVRLRSTPVTLCAACRARPQRLTAVPAVCRAQSLLRCPNTAGMGDLAVELRGPGDADAALAARLQEAFARPRATRGAAAVPALSEAERHQKRWGWRPGDSNAKRSKTGARGAGSAPGDAETAAAGAKRGRAGSPQVHAGAADADAPPAAPPGSAAAAAAAAASAAAAAAAPQRVQRPARLPELAPGALVWAQLPGWPVAWPGRMCARPHPGHACPAH